MSPGAGTGETEHELESLSLQYLAELARAAAGGSAPAINNFSFQAVTGGVGGAIGGTALYRFRLNSAEGPLPSLILKILFRRAGEDETSPYYWKREYELHRSDLLASLPPQTFSLPNVYRCEDRGEACWIWMEDIEDTKDEWSLADFQDIARRLGRFNGAWLAAEQLPAYPWLSANWHSAIVPALADAFDSLDLLLQHPLAQIALPLEDREEIEAIWRDRQLFRGALQALPQTFCHNDAFRRNVMHSRNGVMLLDWALAGPGAIGADLVSLVAVSLFYDGFSQDFAAQLDRAVFDAFISGLRQAGWTGDARLARIGYTCAMTLRGLAGVKQDITQLTDESCHAQLYENHSSDNLREIAELFAAVRRFRLLTMAREARRLLSDAALQRSDRE